MNRIFRSFPALGLAIAAPALAQNSQPAVTPAPPPVAPPAPASPPDPFAAIPAANPQDVASIDAIMASIYGVISGDAGVKRDWNRFRSLFYPGAKLIPTGMNPRTKMIRASMITPEQYISSSGAYIEKEGFHEVEVARRTETYGNIAHVFTTYAARNKLSDPEPFLRGINSVQLFNDGKRWWVLNIAWSQEGPESPLPAKYLSTPAG